MMDILGTEATPKMLTSTDAYKYTYVDDREGGNTWLQGSQEDSRKPSEGAQGGSASLVNALAVMGILTLAIVSMFFFLATRKRASRKSRGEKTVDITPEFEHTKVKQLPSTPPESEKEAEDDAFLQMVEVPAKPSETDF